MKLDTNVGRMDKRIVIQVLAAESDNIGNQITVWENFHKCWANVGGVSGKEYWQAREQHEEKIISFKLRYCRKLDDLNSTGYRIMYNGKIYNIQYIDNLHQANSLLVIKARNEDLQQWQTK